MPKGKKGFSKGHKRLGGRRRGSVNKFTSLKTAYVDVFKELQKKKETSLLTIAKNNPAGFYDTMAKMLPKEVLHSGADGGAVPVKLVIEDFKK